MPNNQQDDRFSLNPKDMVIGAQMLFVAFGALVLVPLLTCWAPVSDSRVSLPEEPAWVKVMSSP